MLDGVSWILLLLLQLLLWAIFETQMLNVGIMEKKTEATVFQLNGGWRATRRTRGISGNPAT